MLEKMTRTITHLLSQWRSRRVPAEGPAPQPAETWLWVIREDAPVRQAGDTGWWTCHKETRAGDLALVYRTAPRKDIAYVVRAVSDAFPREPDDGIAAKMPWACDYVVVEVVERPLSLDRMWADSSLEEWGALRARFVGGVHRIPGGIWHRLLQLLDLSPELLDELTRAVLEDYWYERDIEGRLYRSPRRFARAGVTGVVKVKRQKRFTNGRIADLILTMPSGLPIVVELKRGCVRPAAVQQLQEYRELLAEELGLPRPPRGLLVGSELHPDAQAALRRVPDVRFVPLADLGFRRGDRPTTPTSRRRP